MISTPYFDDLQKESNSYSRYNAAKRAWLMKIIGFSIGDLRKTKNTMEELKERIKKTGIKNNKLAELIDVNPCRLSEHLNYGTKLGKKKEERLDYILQVYENIEL